MNYLTNITKKQPIAAIVGCSSPTYDEIIRGFDPSPYTW
jgi:hypothetical protein